MFTWTADSKKFAAKNWGTGEMPSNDAWAAVYTGDRKGNRCFNLSRRIEVIFWDSRTFCCEGSSRNQSKWTNQANRYAHLRKASTCGDNDFWWWGTDNWWFPAFCFRIRWYPMKLQLQAGSPQPGHEMGLMLWLVVFKLKSFLSFRRNRYKQLCEAWPSACN